MTPRFQEIVSLTGMVQYNCKNLVLDQMRYDPPQDHPVPAILLSQVSFFISARPKWSVRNDLYPEGLRGLTVEYFHMIDGQATTI